MREGKAFCGTSLVAQMVKNLPAMWETQARSLGREDSLEKGMAIHSSILAWRIPVDRGARWATVHGVTKSWTWLRLKLKKVGKTTRPFRYDLNQIPYDYTVEVRNRFKGLDLIECLMNYGMRFVTLYRSQGSRLSPWKRNAKKQNGCLGRPYK